MKLFLYSIFVLNVLFVNGQYFEGTKIDHSKVNKWVTEYQIDFNGTYHFGVSEGESTLIVLTTENHLIAQIKSGEWNEDATDWVWHYKNLTDPKIHQNYYFNADEYHGEFVIFDHHGKREFCLAIYDSWSGITPTPDHYELGLKTGSIKEYFSGKYTIASTTELDSEALKNMTTQELKIMRNEIFARYGYTFRKGGAMATYFKKQKWYKPQHTNVDDFLTELEKSNIKLIQIEEQKR